MKPCCIMNNTMCLQCTGCNTLEVAFLEFDRRSESRDRIRPQVGRFWSRERNRNIKPKLQSAEKRKTTGLPIDDLFCFDFSWIMIRHVLRNYIWSQKRLSTVYPKKYAHGFCFAVLCCGYTLTDFPISIRLTSLALWQSNDCPSASKATLMNMDKYFMWIHYERLHNHNKAKHNKTVCIFLRIYCTSSRHNEVHS